MLQEVGAPKTEISASSAEGTERGPRVVYVWLCPAVGTPLLAVTSSVCPKVASALSLWGLVLLEGQPESRVTVMPPGTAPCRRWGLGRTGLRACLAFPFLSHFVVAK